MTEYVQVDWKFVDKQLKNSTLIEDEQLLVRKLLHGLEQVGVKHDQLTNLKGVVGIAVSLLNSEAISSDDQNQWVDAVPGELVNRDRVRVRLDAYAGTTGVKHNGKTGRVVTLRNGKAAVVYDNESIETPPQHEISALQKLV